MGRGRFLILCFLFSSLSLSAQWDLSHTALSIHDGLPSNTIYGVFQDKKGAIYIATSKGFCRYNGNEIKLLSGDEALGFYDFVALDTNTIYTNTFQNRSFQYSDASQVFLEKLNWQNGTAFYRFLLGEKQQLFRYSNAKVEQLTILPNDTVRLVFSRESLGRIIACTTFAKELVVLYSDSIFFVNQQSYQVEKVFSIHTGQNSNLINKFQQLIHFNPHLGTYQLIENTKVGPIRALPHYDPSDKYACTVTLADSSIAIGTWGGLYIYDKHFEFKGKYFQNSQIASLCEDIEGNLLIGTQQEGLLIVKSRNAFSIPTSFYLTNNFKTCSITSVADSLLLLGSLDGRIAFFNRKGILVKMLDLGKKSEVQTLAYNAYNNKVYAHCFNMFEINVKQKRVINSYPTLSVKDFSFQDQEDFWIATSYGLAKHEKGNLVDHFFTDLWIKKLHRVGEDLILFTKSGLYRYNVADGALKHIYLKSKTDYFNPDDIKSVESFGDTATLLLIKNGVFLMNENKLEKIFQLNNDVARKVISYRNQLLLLGKKALYVFNKDKVGEKRMILPSLQKDFNEFNLFTVFNRPALYGLQSFHFFDSIKSVPLDVSNLYMVKIGGSFVKKNEFYQSTFSDNQLNVTYEVLPNLASGSDTRVFYRILGLGDSKWTSNDKRFSVVQQRLPSGSYTLEAKAIAASGITTNVVSILLKVGKPFYATYWFIALLFTILSLVIYTWFKIRMQKIMNKKKAEIAVERLKIKALNAELKTIRSQMNPHFIFNSINSIQSKILGNEQLKAYENLSSFATLLRQSLDYSCKEFILLSQELDFLKNYTTLEQLRTDNAFEFKFEVESTLPIKSILFPSLLSQPFVENAIRHGLKHVSNKKLLIVRVYGDPASYTLEIIDNGIGVEKSRIINQGKNKTHISFATKAIQERIELINESKKMFIELTVLDENPGTRICLKIQNKEKV